MTLTLKQRTKVNAALCIIHDHGFDVEAVNQLAKNIMATGQDARAAYERALNSFADDNPEIGPALGKMTQLIEASSPGTVAQYDHALSQYIETGNDAALTALAPTIAQDSIALAIHNGEMTEADAANGGLGMALGFQPGPLLEQAIAPVAETPPGYELPAGMKLADAQSASLTSQSQFSAAQGPGYVAPKARASERFYAGFAPDAPALNGLTSQAAREAARASIMSGSRATFDEGAIQ